MKKQRRNCTQGSNEKSSLELCESKDMHAVKWGLITRPQLSETGPRKAWDVTKVTVSLLHCYTRHESSFLLCGRREKMDERYDEVKAYGGGGGLAPLMRDADADADLLLTFPSMLGRDLELPRKDMLEIELWRCVG
jgi:hypothetical protein